MDAPTVTEARDALEGFYRAERDKLWRALLLFCGDQEIASDAVAEAFAQALRRDAEIREIDRWIRGS